MELAAAIALKALFLVLLFGVARLSAIILKRITPEGRLKRLLFFDDGKFP